MPFRTSNHGRTTVWILGLLLLLVGAMAWALRTPDPPPALGLESPSTSSPTRTSNSEREAGKLETVVPAQPKRTDSSYLPRFGKVSGRVLAAEWVIWPSNIVLTLAPQTGGEPRFVVGASEEDSRYSFDKVPFGNYRLTLTAPECQTQNLLITLSPEQAEHFLAIGVVPAASVIGTVVDHLGDPVVHVPVAATLYSTDPARSQAPYVAMTDEEGKFRITGLRDGEFEVYVGTFRNPLSEVQIIGISRDAPEAWVAFRVEKMGSAKVQINFLDGAKAKATDWRTMRVQATRTGDGPHFSDSLSVRENGQVYFPSLPPGNYSFVAYGGPYRKVMRSASVAPDLPANVTIPMRRYAQRRK